MDLLEGLGDLQAKVKKGSGGEARQGALMEAEASAGGLLGEALVDPPPPLPLGKAWRRRFEAGRQFGLSFIQQRDQNYVERASDRSETT